MLSREELLEMADKEVAGIARADFDNPEQMARAKGLVRAVLDEHGKLIQMLPGPDELKESGLGAYKKQMRAAFRGYLAKLWRKGAQRVFGSNKQAILDSCHALKQDLGRDWKRFYAKLLVGESDTILVPLPISEPLPDRNSMKAENHNMWDQYGKLLSGSLLMDALFTKNDKYYKTYVKNSPGVLAHLAEKGDIDESYVEELARNTGRIFNKYPLQIYETKIEQASKQAFATDGGLYVINIEIRPDEFRTFFAKKHGKKDEYLRTLMIQPMLARITDKVSPIIAQDSYNDITVEKYINGETLTHTFKRTMDKGDFLDHIKDPAERAIEEKSIQEFNDQKKKAYLIPALDELIEISQAVGKNRHQFKDIRTLGGAGKSFIQWFKEKYKPNNANLVALVEENITLYMNMEQTVFCHGDAHTDNVIEQLHNPHWIDWEYAHFSIPQLDLAKFLKKTGLSKEAEEAVVRHACEKRGWNDCNLFSRIYYKTKILDDLISAAKYRKMSFGSRKHRAEKQAQADIYFTDALRLIEGDETIHDDAKVELAAALEKDAKGRFTRLADDEYKRISKELDPYKISSIENLGTPSIMEKYSRPPLTERIGKLWKKHKMKVAAGIATIGAFAAGYFVNGEIKADELRQTTKMERTSKYYADTEKNEKLMPFVGKYAAKYGNVNADELAAVINAAYQQNKRNADALLDYRQNPEPWAHDAGVQMKKEAGKLKSGLSVEQSFVKEENLEDPENNVFAAAKRLSEMKKEFKNIEDAILAFFTSPEFVRKWKKGRSYWDYSKDKEFDWDTSYKHCYKTLTDMTLAYLKK